MLVIFLVGMFVGACGVIGAQLVAGRFEPLQIPWRPLPDRVQTLARWGELREQLRPRRIRPTILIPSDTVLPVRIPGASLIDVPAEDAPLHVNEFVSKGPSRLYIWWQETKNRFLLAESDEAFARWWEDTWATAWPTAQRGRHRREDRWDTDEWRMEWAKYDTQRWPTLATTGNAWDIRANAVVICTSMLPVWPKQLANVM